MNKKPFPMTVVLVICLVITAVLGSVLFIRLRVSKNGGNNNTVRTENKVVVEKEPEEESEDSSVDENSKEEVPAVLTPEETRPEPGILADGCYSLASALDNTVMLRAQNGSGDTGTGAELWDVSDLGNEMYYIELQEDGYYKIINKNSNLSLDVKDASPESGAKCQHREYDGSEGQKWKISADDEGHFKIESAIGNCLDCSGGGHVNGTEVLLVQDNGGMNQKWDLYRDGIYNQRYGIRTGDYKIATAMNLNKVLAPSGMEFVNDMSIVLADIGGDEQICHIEMQMDGYYEILTADRSKSYSVKDASPESGAILTLNEYSATIGQQWTIDITEDGYYSISSPLGTYVDNSEGSLENGNEILLCDFNANPNQKWVLLPDGLLVGDISAISVEGANSGGTAEVPQTVESGLYQITSAMDDEKALHIAGETNAEGTGLDIGSKQNGSDYFTFFIGDNGDETYRITSDASGGLSMDVMDASPESGAHLQMRKYDATTGQRWIIAPSSDGTRYIIKSELGTCIDIDHASTEDGTPVNMFQVTESDNQLWNLHRIG